MRRHCLLSVLLLAATPLEAAAVTIEEFDLPNPHGVVTSLTRGPDSRMWFIEYDYTAFKAWLGRIDADGTNVVEYPLSYNAGPNTIAHIEGDDSIWFTETSANLLGRSDVNGNIVYSDLPMGATGPIGIAPGIGLKLVFTMGTGNAIGTVNSDFSAVHVDTFPIPTGSANPLRVATATTFLDYWFTEQGASSVARMSAAGDIVEFPVPTPDTYPLGIAAGNTGRFWFCERTGNALGEIVDDGDLSYIVEHPLPPGSGPFEIALGPDNHVWFAEVDSGTLGVVANINGPIIEFTIPNAATNRHPAAIARGIGQTVWFGEFAGGRIGRISDLNGIDPVFAAGFER
jgi:virginiamycin B lyase